jgi:hypothetical protein
MRTLATDFCTDTKANRVLEQTKVLLKFVASFDEEYPNLKNIRTSYEKEYRELKLLSLPAGSQSNLALNLRVVGLDTDEDCCCN